jgi:hypothetical protein
MKVKSTLAIVILATAIALIPVCVHANARATVKKQIKRAENPTPGRAWLVLPYAFATDDLGTVFGVGGFIRGFGQEQLLVAGTLFGGPDETYGGVLGAWDYRPPLTERFFITAVGSYGHYPKQRAYFRLQYPTDEPRRGSNDSDKDDFTVTPGENNWADFKLEYTVPIGAARSSGMMTYRLKDGMLQGKGTGGDTWNPLKGGVTTLLLRQYNRLESFDLDVATFEQPIHPIEIAIGYDNTDFPNNPSTGSSQYLSYKHDFGWGDALYEWNFWEFEASKYFSLGESRWARQRVVALNFWTGDSPSWTEEINEEGNVVITDRPPQYDGATLGGFYRMRAYPSRRFNDRSVIYTTAEYRYTFDWNPIGEISWLRWLHMDWWQLVGFVEGGRVANEYSFSELFSDWKVDAGMGIRALMAGSVVRFDWAISDEGSSMWVMFQHPF